jgi:hypothetical protein
MLPADGVVCGPAAGWGAYLSYGLPATIQLCTEWWMYEVVIFMAGEPLAQCVVTMTTMMSSLLPARQHNQTFWIPHLWRAWDQPSPRRSEVRHARDSWVAMLAGQG